MEAAIGDLGGESVITLAKVDFMGDPCRYLPLQVVDGGGGSGSF